MSGGGKAPKAAVSTQQLGRDKLTRGVAGQLRKADLGAGVPDFLQNLAGAQGANGLTDPSVDLLRRTISGEFTDPSAISGQIEAAASPILQQFRRSIAPSIAGRFAASGRTGSGAEVGAFEDASEGVSRSIAQITGDLLGQERGRQQQAAGIFPQIQQQNTAAAQTALNAEQLPFQQLLQVAGAIPSLRTTTSTGAQEGKAGKGGALGGLAGGVAGSFLGPVGGAAGASLGNSLFGQGG